MYIYVCDPRHLLNLGCPWLWARPNRHSKAAWMGFQADLARPKLSRNVPSPGNLFFQLTARRFHFVTNLWRVHTSGVSTRIPWQRYNVGGDEALPRGSCTDINMVYLENFIVRLILEGGSYPKRKLALK